MTHSPLDLPWMNYERKGKVPAEVRAQFVSSSDRKREEVCRHKVFLLLRGGKGFRNGEEGEIPVVY